MGAEIYILVAFVVCLIVAACIFFFNITCPTFGYCCSCSTGSCSMQLFGLTEGCTSASVDTPSSNTGGSVCLPPANPGIPGTSASTFAGTKGAAQGMTGDTFGLSGSDSAWLQNAESSTTDAVTLADMLANAPQSVTDAINNYASGSHSRDSVPYDGTGVGATFYAPWGLTTDDCGNIFVADAGMNLVRKITPSGVVTTVSGDIIRGYVDTADMTATFCYSSSKTTSLTSESVDSSTTRVWSPASTDMTLWGTSTAGQILSASASGCPTDKPSGRTANAHDPRFAAPADVALDSGGNIFVADFGNNCIRKIDGTTFEVTTFAGSPGYHSGALENWYQTSGSMLNATGTAARFNKPMGLAFDSSGNLFVADMGNYLIRKITPAGVVSTFAGSGTQGIVNGVGTAASFFRPMKIAFDKSGIMYVADFKCVRKIKPDGTVSLFVGGNDQSGRGAYAVDGIGGAATLAGTTGIAIDILGNIYLADTTNIRKVTPTGVVTTVVKVTDSLVGGGGGGLAIDPSGNLYIANVFNDTIDKIAAVSSSTSFSGSCVTINSFSGSSGQNRQIAGNGNTIRLNGAEANASLILTQPVGIVIDSKNSIYISDAGNHRICKIDNCGNPISFAGPSAGFTSGLVNGTGEAARFNYPGWMCIDSSDNLYVLEMGNNTIRKITPDAVVTTVATLLAPVANSSLFFPKHMHISIRPNGNMLVCHTTRHTIYEVTPTGTITTWMGTGAGGWPTGTRSTSALYLPLSTTTDSAGNVYIFDMNQVMFKVDTSDNVSRIVGTAGVSGYVDSTALNAKFQIVDDMKIDSSGNFYVIDSGNKKLRKIDTALSVTTIPGTNFNVPTSVALDSTGNIYVVEVGGFVTQIKP